ncbi:MAG: hypothetical protein Tsb0034_10050 [Ekhidna sp.]
MEKLALGLSLVSLLCIALFFALSYAMGLLEERREVNRPFLSKSLKMTRKLDLDQDQYWKQAA